MPTKVDLISGGYETILSKLTSRTIEVTFTIDKKCLRGLDKLSFVSTSILQVKTLKELLTDNDRALS